MDRYSEYISAISMRGDHYGDHGGLNSLLAWCDKNSLKEVTEEEAKMFLEHPDADYQAFLAAMKKKEEQA